MKIKKDELFEKAIFAFGYIPKDYKLSASVWNSLDASVWNSLDANLWNSLPASVWNSLDASAWNSVPVSVWDSLPVSVWNSLPASVWDSLDASVLKSVPKLEQPYIKLWNDIVLKKRSHDQTIFGTIQDYDPNLNVCETAMCTAGHLVNMAGKEGYALKNKYGFALAALLIHKKAHPDYPAQNFVTATQESALAYIEWMAENEKDDN